MAKFGAYDEAALPLDGDELLLVRQSSTTRKIALAALGSRDVTPLMFDGVGDGATDDSVAIRAAIVAAASSGRWLDGQGKTYAVTGQITLTSGMAGLRNVTLKQLSSGESTKTLYATGVSGLQLDRVKVNRNGTGTSGGLNTAAGIWLDSCDDAQLLDCEVYGNDKGNGIAIWSSNRVRIVRPYVHDIRYNDVAIIDDTIQGIWLVLCDDFVLDCPIVENMGKTDQTTNLRDRFSRGVAVSGCNGFTINSPTGRRLDQWIDISGSLGASRGVIVGGHAKWILSNGVKVSSSGADISILGTIVEGVGAGGFIFGPPSVLQQSPVSSIKLVGCASRNAGAPGLGTAAGFYLTSGSAPFTQYPKAMEIDACSAYSDEGSSTFTVSTATTLLLASPMPAWQGTRCRLTTTGSLPSPLATGTDYYLVPNVNAETNLVGLATSYINAQDGVVVGALTGGSGTHTITLFQDMAYGALSSGYASFDSGAPPELRAFRAAGYTTAATSGWPTPFSVVSGAAQSISDNTETVLIYNAASSDTLGLVTLASGIMTAHRSGSWRAEVDIAWAANTANTRQLYFMLSSAGGAWAATGGAVLISAGSFPSGNPVNNRISWSGLLAKGDRLRVAVVQNSGGALNCTPSRLVFQLASDYSGGV